MSRRLVMTLAMSLDGYIADEGGGYGWIRGDGNKALNTKNKWDYDAFLAGVDAVVMGRKCYDQNMHLDFTDKAVFVATSSPVADHGPVRFISGDICQVIRGEMAKEGKEIFLFGGGKLVDNFVKADMIDEYIIGVIPMILGGGRPLFYGGGNAIPLALTEYMADEGVVILRYVRRPGGTPS